MFFFSPWGASNEYPQHMFSWRNKKNINTFGLKKKHLIKSQLWFWNRINTSFPYLLQVQQTLTTLLPPQGVVGWCEGVMCLMTAGRLTGIGLQMDKASYPCRGGMFLFLLFLHFHSSFFPVPLFYLFYYLFYLFSPFLWEMTQNDPQGLMCH